MSATPPRPAKYATPRDPSRPTHGRLVAATSASLGQPFMPWQDQVADTALELDAGGRGYRYKTVIVTVPRQAGKTTLLRALNVCMAIIRPRQGIWMTAQTGKDARKRWRDILQATTDRESPLRGMVRPYLSGGAERLDFPNGSYIAPFAPVPKSLHGETPPLVTLDEVWAYDQDQGGALLAAIRPAQITIPHRQLWLVSTKGTADSEFWNGQLDLGRRSLERPGTDIAFFEWSADEGLAKTDPAGAATLAFHPALGHTQQLADLQAEAEADPNPANYRRGFLNLQTVSATTVVDLDAWDELAHDPAQHAPELAAGALGFAVSAGRAGSSVWHAWPDGETVRLRFVETAPGARWVPARLHQLRTAGAATIGTEDAGASRTVTTSPEVAGLDLTALTVRDYATACGVFLGRVADGTLSHDGAPELRSALEAAEARPMGGGVGFDERHSRGPIDALKAAVIATYLADRYTGPQLF